MIVVFLSAIYALWSEGGQVPEAGLAPRQLVQLHDATVQSIHQLDVTVEVYAGPKSDQQELIRYSFDHGEERVRSEAASLELGPGRFIDTFRTANYADRLTGADPKRPARIEDPFVAKGQIGVRLQPGGHEMDFKVLSVLGLRFSVDVPDRHWLLSELALESIAVHGEDGVKLIAVDDMVDGFKTSHLCIRHPGLVNLQTGLNEHERDEVHVWLDPTVGYLARKFELHRKSHGDVEDYVITYRIVSFRSYPNGVFFPTEVVGTGLYGNVNPKSVNPPATFKVSAITVNSALPEDAMSFQFPENLLVSEVMPDGQFTFHLMGKDNKIIKSFSSQEEIERQIPAMLGQSPNSGVRLSFGALILNALLVVSIVALIARRRLKRKRMV